MVQKYNGKLKVWKYVKILTEVTDFPFPSEVIIRKQRQQPLPRKKKKRGIKTTSNRARHPVFQKKRNSVATDQE